VRFQPSPVLRGQAKLQAALDELAPGVAGRVALDLGAAAGGFTRALLAAGAARVYAVDAGHGQLLGSLRQDARVVNLESTNLGQLDGTLVPEAIGVVTVDLSYLSLARALPQLDRIVFETSAELVALCKPMFELGLATPPEEERLPEALARAVAGVQDAGWEVLGTMRSRFRGARGAVEFFVHGRRRPS
jgi:23S rRNA (cytidine1920-2'-O)/16S rRNA (cytidine1409-2'-O)-methyltransferase